MIHWESNLWDLIFGVQEDRKEDTKLKEAGKRGEIKEGQNTGVKNKKAFVCKGFRVRSNILHFDKFNNLGFDYFMAHVIK